MKKQYVLAFVTACILFTGAYYASYQHSLREEAKRGQETAAAGDETGAAGSGQRQAGDTGSGEKEPMQPVAWAEEPVVHAQMKYIRIVSDPVHGSAETKETAVPAAILGMNREELVAYLQEETKRSGRDAAGDGPVHYELVAFSREEVRVRETVMADVSRYECFVIAEGEFVNVYTADRSALYLDTILYRTDFAAEVQEQLTQGIYMETAVELYDFLQNHTS